MKKISITAVVIGSVTDIVSTSVVMIPLTVYIMFSEKLMALPPDKGGAAVMELMITKPLYYALSMILGALCSILGGYIAARIAKHDEILNASLASFLCVGSGLYGLYSDTHAVAPLWQHTLFLFLSPCMTAFGGYIRLRQVKR